MSSRVNLRLTELIRKRAAHVILFELKDPRMGFVTVTRVKLAPDFTSCVIFWSVFGSEGDRSKTKHALESSKLFVQRRVAEGLRTRNAPQISFEYDESVEGAIKMGELLHQLRDQRPPEIPAEGALPADGALPSPDAAAPDAAARDAGSDDEADEGDEADTGDEADAPIEDGGAADTGPGSPLPARKKVRPFKKLRAPKGRSGKSPRRR